MNENNNTNNQELTERYIYQVIRRLPKAQREDVAMELRELISDMADEKGSVEAALIALGDPAEFAKKYTGDSNFLIGPNYYATYLTVLKIALMCTAISVFVIVLLQTVFEGYSASEIADLSDGIQIGARAFSKSLGSMISSVIGVFGSVTLVFAIMERQKVDLDEVKEKEWTTADLAGKPTGERHAWTPDQLTSVPSKKALLPRSESIVDIVFSIVLAALFIFAPQIFGMIWINDDLVMEVSVFNLDKWNIILPFFLISLAIGLVDAILKLIIGRYNIKVMVSTIITALVQSLIAIITLKVLPIWNPDFGNELQQFFNDHPDEIVIDKFGTYFDSNGFSNIILGFIIVFTAIDIAVTVYKTMRYGSEAEKAK
ncbi:MAG: hypothetical protein GXY06_08615 [Clostridiaceae bacterium]|nr:hypothetical protein [Clostridiaceae bacterium]